MAQTFGRRLREVRGRLKITQRDLADRTGLQQASLSNLEGNKKKPSIPTIERLATALNVAPLDLVAGTEMHGRYASERVSPGDREIQERAERRRQSSKIVAIHEIYRRIVALHQLHLTGHVLEGLTLAEKLIFSIFVSSCRTLAQKPARSTRSSI